MIGRFDGGVGTSVLLRGPGRALGSTSLVKPTGTVTIYKEPACAGPPVATGEVQEFTGGGIRVEVSPLSTTTFYAKESEGGQESECSNPITYRHVESPPEPPTLSTVSPPSGSNNNAPHLIGSAEAGSTVALFANSVCTGTPLASGSAATFAGSGIAVPVGDNTTTTFYAIAGWAGLTSSCSSTSLTYEEVTPGTETGGGGGGQGGGGGGASPPPAPRIHTVPGGTANDNTPLVTGSAPGAATVRIFASGDCSGPVVAKGAASQFDAPGLQVQVADNAVVTFSAVSVSDGGQSSCSDAVQYVEDSTPPHTRITMGPAAKTRHRNTVFRFTDTSGDPPGTAFLCRVDKRKWRHCSSPLRLQRLKPKVYVVRVKATDPAGNVETRAAKRRFRVVAHP